MALLPDNSENTDKRHAKRPHDRWLCLHRFDECPNHQAAASDDHDQANQHLETGPHTDEARTPNGGSVASPRGELQSLATIHALTGSCLRVPATPKGDDQLGEHMFDPIELPSYPA